MRRLPPALLLSLALASASLAAPASVARTVFDAHVHLWNGEASLAGYKETVATGEGELVGIAAMWFGGPNQAAAGDVAAIRKGNDSIIALAAKHPEVVPVATVHPYDGEAALEELARVAAQGVKVLKLHPHTQRFDAADPRVLAVATRAGELGMTVLMDNANILPGDSERLFNLAIAAPGTKFIFAHMGGMNFRFWNILKLIRTADDFFADNIYFDISGPLFLAVDSPIEQEFVWTLRNVGIDRVILGSDHPQWRLDRAVDALERLDLREEEKERIRVGNARRLFDR